jgi:glutaconate CoA-transferase subunit A
MTLVAGLRAASYGIPFQPVAGVFGSDLAKINDWKSIADPYSGKEVYAIPAIRPDIAVIHVNEVDEFGNARVYGTPFWDHPLTRAARRVLITAEKLVTTDDLREQPELTLVPAFMVEAIAIVPNGAWPGSMHPNYEIDYPAVERYMKDDAGSFEKHLAEAPEVSQ